MNKSWIYVILTSVFELIWIYGFNIASTWWHWVFIISAILLDLHFLSKACEGIPTGTVYAIFAAAGTVGTALMDVYIFDGSLSMGKIFFMFLLVVGVIGLKLFDAPNQSAKQEVHS
ncbi:MULTISPECIES: DMT family transporter [Virgibacillus]|uniref:Ligand-binding protein SH3 n=1 Tax=Virgibacillus pantothenticus TaxID=1473 RepID=A0A0L0QRI0_VIRPA|nr:MULTISPECIES: SMR family transporter [Virgibacillus]API92182.1 ligand-binding protein SH3 [Virgibacillus sp. 6R]KNE21209.1 ligand-binding protein SH3 [Virgibacillus pantothenticus]MBS7427222.1 QacE family quaternary ammonium compound efflux SMR transporter [Virgibacillus sp. 19R1-5]MBU8568675.1 QacE family quaternary ammonium compound efflux SMR transporter [Virgibacillus pantothenticus]MBU8602656.1 QacE family quaternary ammonium compound efflux SMR transporter [Virgibacillus pantothenticu